MLSLLDKSGSYQLPTGWHEVSTRDYCELDRLQLRTMEARASFFAERPIQVNVLVAEALSWMLTPPSSEGGHSHPEDLGQETFLQVESIKQLLAKQPLHECFPQVYGLYMARVLLGGEFRQPRATQYASLCLDWKTTQTYPVVAHCLTELARLNAAFAPLYQPDDTEAGRKAKAAGADRLAAFGHLNVARLYAREFGTTIDAIYQMPWQTVALFMYQDKVTSEIQDNLQRTNTTKHD